MSNFKNHRVELLKVDLLKFTLCGWKNFKKVDFLSSPHPQRQKKVTSSTYTFADGG